MWEEQSRAKRDEKDKAADLQPPSPAVEVVEEHTLIGVAVIPNNDGIGTQTEASENLTPSDVTSVRLNGRESPVTSLDLAKASIPTLSETNTIMSSASVVNNPTPPPTRSSESAAIASALATNDINEPTTIQTTPPHSLHSSMSTSTLASSYSSNTPPVQHNQTSKLSPANSTASNVTSLPRSIYSTALPPSPSATTSIAVHIASSIPASAVNPPPVVTIGGSGESIYRTIMNRLTALEANHTLYTRYVEQQTSGVRDVLKRLGEDIGRLEAS